MNYKKTIKIFLMIICVLSISIYTKTEAKQTCTIQEQNNLIQLAHNVKFNYELLPNLGNNNRLFMMTISNLVEGIEVRYGFSVYAYDKNKTNPGIAEMSEVFSGGQTHSITIYASAKTNCYGDVLTTKVVSLPKYNSYSEREECQGIEEFKLCQKWYAGNIKENEFKKQVQQYKEKIKNKEEPKIEKEKSTSLENLIQLYKENTLVSITVVLLALLIITMVVRKIIKNKKRTKIDL